MASSRLSSPTRRSRPIDWYTAQASRPASRRDSPRGIHPRLRATASTSQYSILSLIFKGKGQVYSTAPDRQAWIPCGPGAAGGPIREEGHEKRPSGRVSEGQEALRTAGQEAGATVLGRL